jgi:hypothetical protein
MPYKGASSIDGFPDRGAVTVKGIVCEVNEPPKEDVARARPRRALPNMNVPHK